MPAGRPRRVHPGTLYAFAHQFYWDFRLIAEGKYRWRLDEKEYEQLVNQIEPEAVRLSQDQKSHLSQVVEQEIREGRLTEADRDKRLRDLEDSQLFVTRDWLRSEAAEQARKQLRVPGEPDVLKALLQARTPEQVRRICKDAFVLRTVQVEPGVTKEVRMPNWPIHVGSPLPRYLSQYASQFIAAKNDKRYPASNRPTSQLKQLWFLSRALAGALYNIEVRTAINLVGSKRPEQIFEESRAGKPTRTKRK